MVIASEALGKVCEQLIPRAGFTNMGHVRYKCGGPGPYCLSLSLSAVLRCPCKILLTLLLFSLNIVSWNRGLGPVGLHSSVIAMDSDAENAQKKNIFHSECGAPKFVGLCSAEQSKHS